MSDRRTGNDSGGKKSRLTRSIVIKLPVKPVGKVVDENTKKYNEDDIDYTIMCR